MNSEPVLNDSFDCPSVLIKMKQKMVALRDHSQSMKREITNINNELKLLESTFDKYLAKIAKQQIESKRTKKPSGFAAPVKISSVLCEFMGLEPDTMVSRTDVTKYINSYIKTHKLQDPVNKTVINPDAKLRKVLDVADNEIVEYFSLQKRLNPHFI
jgi:chromatin remodeling complex protein RSC6